MVHHGRIAPSRSVERYGVLDLLAAALDMLLVRPRNDISAAIDVDVSERPARLVRALLKIRHDHFVDVLECPERVQQYAVAHLARHLKHPLVDRRDINLDVRVFDRIRREERRHKVEVVEVALKVQPRTMLPAPPDMAQRLNVLAHPRSRPAPRHIESPDDMAAHLAAHPKLELPAGQRLQVPGVVSRIHWAARERQRNGCTHLRALNMLRGKRRRNERVVLGLAGRKEVVAEFLRLPHSLRNVRHQTALHSCAYFHLCRLHQSRFLPRISYQSAVRAAHKAAARYDIISSEIRTNPGV